MAHVDEENMTLLLKQDIGHNNYKNTKISLISILEHTKSPIKPCSIMIRLNDRNNVLTNIVIQGL